MRGFLRETVRVGQPQAARDVRAARTIAGVGALLPQLGAALAGGLIQRSHVDVAASVLVDLPGRVLRAVGDDGRTGAQVIDEAVTGLAVQTEPDQVDRLTRQIRQLLDPDHADGLNPASYERRSATFSTDANGMVVLRVKFDPATGVLAHATLEHAATHDADATHDPGVAGGAVDADGQPVGVPEARTYNQRMADAVTDRILHTCQAETTPPPATDSRAVRKARTPHRPAPTPRPRATLRLSPGPTPRGSPGPTPRGSPGPTPRGSPGSTPSLRLRSRRTLRGVPGRVLRSLGCGLRRGCCGRAGCRCWC